jgi:PucR family transcriptional regulator, purine catabolism regulatory protein
MGHATIMRACGLCQQGTRCEAIDGRLHTSIYRVSASKRADPSIRVDSLRVRELLEIDLLLDAGAHVVAGEQHLDREVRWVHTGEIADIAQYLSGGEVLLTAATGLQRGVEAQRRRYIRELVEADVACVIIELGRSFDEIPAEMVEEAAKGRLVLVALEHEVPFVAVTQHAHTMLVSSAHVTLERAMGIDDALNALMLEGAPLPAVLELLAERLDNPVIVEDGARRAIAHGGAPGSVTPLLRAWQGHSRQGHRVDRTAAVQRADDPVPCTWAAIAVRGEDWGRIHVVQVDSQLSDLARITLGRAAASIALYLMSERDAALSDAAEHSLIGGLTTADRFNGREFLARASGLGVNLDGDLVMLVIGPRSRSTTVDGDALASAVDEVRKVMRSGRWPAVVGGLNGAVGVAATADPPGGLDRAAETLMAALRTLPFDDAQVGVSRPCRAAQLPHAQTEAATAHRLGPIWSSGSVHNYENLVLYRLLSPLASGPGLANFVEEELGPLLACGEQQRSELLRTLDAYLQANGNKIATAQALFLQRRSVYYRLERIEEMLGRSLNDPDQRVRLYMAMRAYELLDARVGGAEGMVS